MESMDIVHDDDLGGHAAPASSSSTDLLPSSTSSVSASTAGAAQPPPEAKASGGRGTKRSVALPSSSPKRPKRQAETYMYEGKMHKLRTVNGTALRWKYFREVGGTGMVVCATCLGKGSRSVEPFSKSSNHALVF